MVLEHAPVFSPQTKDGNEVLPIRHKIVLKDKTEGFRITYGRRSLKEVEEQRKYVKELLDRNLIEKGMGEFAAPMLCVD
ncbi:MAG: hypothetical protein ACK53Y_26060 [bacterium]